VRTAQAVCEAKALGAQFRLAGALVRINGVAGLPPGLQAELDLRAADGTLRSYLEGGRDPDAVACALLDQLEVEVTLVETREDVCSAIRQLEADMRSHGGHLGFDIETFPRPGQGPPRPAIVLNRDGTPDEQQPKWKNQAGLDPHRAEIGCAQLYAGGTHAFVFRGPALRRVLGLYWLRQQHLVVHNATFEAKFLAHHARRRLPRHRRNGARLECTAQAAGLLHGTGFGGETRRLDKVVPHYFDNLATLYKDEYRTSDWATPQLTQGQTVYAGADAVLPYRLWPRIEPQLDEIHVTVEGVWRHRDAYELQRQTIPAVAAIELAGLYIDREVHAEQHRRWATQLDKARDKFVELTGQAPPTGGDAKQQWLTRILEDHPEFGADWPLTRTGLLSTRAGQLKRLIDVEPVRAMLAITANEQLISNFGPRLADQISPVTGRIHGGYNLAGTKTGRFSASHPNLQQLPRRRAPEFLTCIQAEEGRLLVACDWSQIEMRAGAWLYEEPVLTAIFGDATRDVHSETAARIAGIPVSDVTGEQRDAAKPVNYGALFGQGPEGLRQTAFVGYGVEMSLLQAQHAVEQFRQLYDVLDRGLRNNYYRCKARGYILIPEGRIIKAEWEVATQGRLRYTLCANAPIQGVCANAILRALTWTHARLLAAHIRGPGIIVTLHDELVLEVDEEDAEKARQILEQTMFDAFCATFPGAPCEGVAQAKIGRSWAETKAKEPRPDGTIKS
jgi:DNA polymerase I-like protein with 3'-5' exonuclease and polymerase domains